MSNNTMNTKNQNVRFTNRKFDGEGNTMTRGIALTSREAIKLAGNLLVWATKLDEVNEKGGE